MTDFMVMDRRAMIARVLTLVGASAAASACQTMDALAPLDAGNENGLSPAQMAVLTAAADKIIPQTDTAGAVAAGVPERLSGLLATWASPATRASMASVLDTINGLPGGGQSFVNVSAQEQHDLLAAYDERAMQPSDQVETVFISSRQLPVDPEYGRLKDLVVALYYLSREALTQELVYEHVPGQWQPSIPVTPDTRPWGDPGGF